MLRILSAEGFKIKERELIRLRARYKWLLRMPNGTNNAIKDSDVTYQLKGEDLMQQTNPIMMVSHVIRSWRRSLTIVIKAREHVSDRVSDSRVHDARHY